MAPLFSRVAAGVLAPGPEPGTVLWHTDASGDGVAGPAWRASVSLAAESVLLELRTAFGTSHSSTTVRTNVRVHVRVMVEGVAGGDGPHTSTGAWEVGLPPKKPFVYEGEVADFPGQCSPPPHTRL